MEYKNASEQIRKCGALIDSVAETRPLFGFGVIPNKETLDKISDELIGISNGLFDGSLWQINRQSAELIRKKL